MNIKKSASPKKKQQQKLLIGTDIVSLLLYNYWCSIFFFFSSRRRHTRSLRDWSSDVCSSDLLDQAAALARVPKQTLYSWSSQERLRGCSRRVGKHLRILRDRFVRLLFNEGINGR